MKRKFSEYDLGYEAGYRKGLSELDENLDIEEPQFITITYNNELFRNILFNKLKKKQKTFVLDNVERPEGFEDAIPLAGQSASDEDEEVKKYYFVSAKDEMVAYVVWLSVDDGQPVFKMEVTGIRHLKNEVKTFRKVSRIISYATSVEAVVDDVEYIDEEED